MTTIRQDDFIQSIADAFQYISYYHPLDYIQALGAAYEREEVAGGEGRHRPDPDQLAHVRRRPPADLPGHRHRRWCSSRSAWTCAGTPSWSSRKWSTKACAAPTTTRTTSCAPRCWPTRPASAPTRKDNTPAVVHYEIVPGDHVEVICAAKGGGSEAKSKFAMLNPSDSIVDWVLKTVPTMGAGWCPPGILGIGIGGTPEKAMLLAKEALMAPVDIQELKARGASNRAEELRLELYEKVNALGIGAQGLGGLTTVLDVKVLDYPTHAANLPVAMIPNCAATRHVHFHLDGSGPAKLEPPRLEDWPQVTWQADARRRHPRQPRHADPRPKSPPGSRARRCCSTARC